MMKKIQFIMLVVGFSGALLTGAYKVWGMEQQIGENTNWILIERHRYAKETVEAIVFECGEEAKNCSKRQQKDYKLWLYRKEKLEEKLGYEQIIP